MLAQRVTLPVVVAAPSGRCICRHHFRAWIHTWRVNSGRMSTMRWPTKSASNWCPSPNRCRPTNRPGTSSGTRWHEWSHTPPTRVRQQDGVTHRILIRMQAIGQRIKPRKRISCRKGANARMVPPRPKVHQVAVVQFAGEAKGLGATRCRDAPRVVARRGLHRPGAIEDGTHGTQPIVLIPCAVAARNACQTIHEIRGAIVQHLLERCHEVLRVGRTAPPHKHTIAVIAVAGAALLGQSSERIVTVARATVIEQVSGSIIGEPDDCIGGVVLLSTIGAVVSTR